MEGAVWRARKPTERRWRTDTGPPAVCSRSAVAGGANGPAPAVLHRCRGPAVGACAATGGPATGGPGAMPAGAASFAAVKRAE